MSQKTPEKSCKQKRKYPDLLSATISAEKSHKKGIRVKPYKCPVCSGFHLRSRNKASILLDLFARIERERLVKA